MRAIAFLWSGVVVFATVTARADRAEVNPATPTGTALQRLLSEELDYSMAHLGAAGSLKPYFLSYTIVDTTTVSVWGSLGALHHNARDRQRSLDVDLRVGDYTLDSTHQIRGRGDERRSGRTFGASSLIAIEDEHDSIQHTLWLTTDRAYKSAVDRFQRVKTDLKTTVEEESKVPDFSQEQPSVFSEREGALALDREGWVQRIREVSQVALKYPLIYDSTVALVAALDTRTIVNSEGTRLQTGNKRLRVIVSASTKAEDGMELSQSYIFNAASEAGLPAAGQMREQFEKVIAMVLALRAAPLVEPYSGPAILRNRASGVFFHEIFGHRIEGHRQKDVEEGQTFTKMVGKPILPDFLSVFDDPTRERFDGEDLRGYYRYDDEGVRASRVNLVDKGVLKTFLLSRSPVDGFANSNGHGRREPGRQVVSRQGNLIVESAKSVPFAKLRELLVTECRKQGKPYGYLFEDITGGFTLTSRGGPQAFKVLPVVVYRIYADGHPDELVRGVDIVGTPLACFSKIVATGDDPTVFNGTCGAESGWVPVSAVSPSILVEQIEIEKRERSQERLPILTSPLAAALNTRSL